jgi:protein-disulfide isomerase
MKKLSIVLSCIALLSACGEKVQDTKSLEQRKAELIEEAKKLAEEEKMDAIASIKYASAHMNEIAENALILGDTNADKTIVIFSSPSCPYSRRLHTELERILHDYNDIRVVVKNFSIHGVLSDAPIRAVTAAKLQSDSKAVALYRLLMTKEYKEYNDAKDQSKVAEEVKNNVMKFAKQVGLDIVKLENDMYGSTVAQEMNQVRDLATRLYVTGTPFLIIGNDTFPGAIPYYTIVEALKI